jgi:hypothetical protein
MTTNILDFGHGTLTLGGGEMICQILSAQLIPSNTRQDIMTACGTTTRFIQEQFDMRMRFMQDWHSSGISKYLWDHYNTDVAFNFSPSADGTPSVAGNLTCPRPMLGGDAQTPLEDDVVAPVVGGVILTADA